jgi:hypothetical protein
MGQVPDIETGGAAAAHSQAETGAAPGTRWAGQIKIRRLLSRLPRPAFDIERLAGTPTVDRWLAAARPLRRQVAAHATDLLIGSGAAVAVAAAGWLLAAGITFGIWAGAAPDTATSAAAFHITGQLWLAAHHVLLRTPDGPFGLTPLGFTLLPLAAFCYAGRYCAERFWPSLGDQVDEALLRHPSARLIGPRSTASTASVDGETDFPSLSAPLQPYQVEQSDPGPAARRHGELWALAALAVSYPLAALLIAWSAASGTLHATVSAAAGYPCLLAVTAFGLGLASVQRPFADRRFTVAVRAVAIAVAVLVAAAALVVAVLLAVNLRRMSAVGAAVGRGAVGETGLFLIDLALAPNLLVWALSVLLGPGFALGVGSSISATGIVHGPLPGLPVLQAIPAAGPASPWALLLFAAPLAAGVGALLQVGRSLQSLRDRAVTFGTVAVVTAFLLAVATALSGGPVAFGPMAMVGPGPGMVALATALEFGAIGVVGFGCWYGFDAVTGRAWQRGAEAMADRLPHFPEAEAEAESEAAPADAAAPDWLPDWLPDGRRGRVRDAVRLDDQLPEHLVRPGLSLGVPERPEVVEDARDEADRPDDQVDQVADQGQPEPDEPAVALPDQPDPDGALADRPAASALEVPLEDAEPEQQAAAEDGDAD